MYRTDFTQGITLAEKGHSAAWVPSNVPATAASTGETLALGLWGTVVRGKYSDDTEGSPRCESASNGRILGIMSIDNAEECNAGVHFRRSGPREYHFHKRILSSDEWAK